MGLKKKIKVVADKEQNQKFKTFEIEINLLTLSQRAKMNDLITDESKPKNFSFWIEVIRHGAEFSDEELNKFSTEEILGIANAIIQDVNSKKK